VFAVDTFVSADSPREDKRFADAPLGDGFVIRALDTSGITPLPLVNRVIEIARRNKIPVQTGTTNGGNDGSTFTRYGAINIPLSWPGRYSHSPVEVMDRNDLEALSAIIQHLVLEF
jgi:putative aminopeptidase FrvX